MSTLPAPFSSPADGGIGAFVAGHEWVAGQCQTYLAVKTPQDELDTYVNMTKQIVAMKGDVSLVIYTQVSKIRRR